MFEFLKSKRKEQNPEQTDMKGEPAPEPEKPLQEEACAPSPQADPVAEIDGDTPSGEQAETPQQSYPETPLPARVGMPLAGHALVGLPRDVQAGKPQEKTEAKPPAAPVEAPRPATLAEAVAAVKDLPLLNTPWPEVEVLSAGPDTAAPPQLQTPEAVEELLRNDAEVQELVEKCRDANCRRCIAKRFIKQFGAKPARESVLLDHAESGDARYWVVGDVHASLSAIAKVWAWIRFRKQQDGGRHILIFLGDVIDRGPEDLETLAFVEHLFLEHEADILYIAGNHDLGLKQCWDGSFTSSVAPSETKDRLNKLTKEGGNVSAEAAAAILLASASPRMIELAGLDPAAPQKTVMLVHGGVPHVDYHQSLFKACNGLHPAPGTDFLSSIPQPERNKVKEDFTWLRFADSLPFKRPNRSSRGCEIGTEDVNAYRHLHFHLTKRALTCIIRGHDHERPGFRIYSYHALYNNQNARRLQNKCTVLTLNTMEPTTAESGLFRNRNICVAHLQQGRPLSVHVLPTRLPVPAADAPAPAAASAVVPPPVSIGGPNIEHCEG